MIGSADQIIVLADSSKFASTSYHIFARLKSVDILISDHLLSEAIKRSLSDQGVRVLTGAEQEQQIM